jgi:2-oxoisovalerate dehydrogenase E1 component
MLYNPSPNKFILDSDKFSPELLIHLYKQLLRPRMIEEKMLLLLRQGKISKWFSGIGQEAISVGCTEALDPIEKIFPMHRNLGVFTSRNMPLEKLFCQWQGKLDGYTKGRDRSFHFGSMEHNIIGMISHLGPQLSLAAGVALGYQLDNKNQVSLAFTGEGATSQGEFHEALNTAAVWKLPVIFIVENNGYGLSTPINEQFSCERISDKGIGYGMKSDTIDGNNILEVYSKIQEIKKLMHESPQPFLLECMTFRMRGHEEASGIKYVPSELFEKWKDKDPLISYQNFLFENKILNEELISQFKSNFKYEIDVAWAYTEAQPEITPNTQEEINDVYAKFDFVQENVSLTNASNVRYIDAISDALNLSMEKNEKLILMGQDIAEYGGAFKITQGFVDKYSKQRVRNTLCESAIIGIGLGLSLEGFKSVIEMQFADFVACGFNQIINNLAKLHYRWGENADVVIRMPAGGGVAAGPFHSQCNEAWFTHTPGLKVVFPSTSYDAKGLLISAIEDPNPVMFFEHKALYRNVSDLVPSEYYKIEIGKANVVKEGNNLTIITYGMAVHWALEATNEIKSSIEIIDLRTLSPLDYDTISQSVMKTGRVIILHEDTLIGGLGGEIAAFISENLFEYLDAPVYRLSSLDTPIPFCANLEQNFLPISRIQKQLEIILGY